MSADRVERSRVGWAERPGGASDPLGDPVTEEDVESARREALALIAADKLDRACQAARAAAREA